MGMNILEKSKLNTRNFLKSYAIQKAMSEVSGYDEALDMETASHSAAAHVKPFDSELKCGQIRVLADVSRLTYVVLLKKLGDNAFITTAFSHYDFPATDKEFALRRSYGAYLSVLQIWNTRTLRAEILKRSWVCGILSENACRVAWDFWRSIFTGAELPVSVRERSGIPIESQDDVRWEYMREETEVFSAVDAADPDDTEAQTPSWFNDSLIIPPLWQTEALPLAAGDEQENRRVKCTIDGRPELLLLEYSPEEKAVWIRIFSAAMERVDSLDGAAVIDAGEHELGVIADGKCRFAAADGFDGSIALRLADGTVCTLTAQS